MRERAFPAKRLLGRAADGVLMACGAAAGCLMLALAYDQLSTPVGYVHPIAEAGGPSAASAPGGHARRRLAVAQPAAFVIRRAGSAPSLAKTDGNATAGGLVSVPLVPLVSFTVPSHVMRAAHVVSAVTAAHVAAVSMAAHAAAAGTVVRSTAVGTAAHAAPYGPVAEARLVPVRPVAQPAPYGPVTEAPRVVALGAPRSSLASRASMRSARDAASMQAMPEPPIGFSVRPTLAVVPEAQSAGPAPAVASTFSLHVDKRGRR